MGDPAESVCVPDELMLPQATRRKVLGALANEALDTPHLRLWRPVGPNRRQKEPSVRPAERAEASQSRASSGGPLIISYRAWTHASGEPESAVCCIGDAEWDVYFGPLRLGRFHERTGVIEDALGRQHRRHY